jgi:methionyl aminopeptidase
MNPDVLEKQRRAGRIARDALVHGLDLMDEGVAVLDVAEETEDFIRRRGAKPAFPATISVDNVAAHHTPRHNDKEVLRRGNLVKLDVGAHIDGYTGDTAGTVEIGTRKWRRLIEASRLALEAAMEVVAPDVPLKVLGAVVERTIESHGFKPVSNLTGHTVERYLLHAGKSIPNIQDDTAERILEDEVVAIEPFASSGRGRVDGRKSGNIYRLIRVREVKPQRANDLLHFIAEEFKTLPFAERWCYAHDARAPSDLNRLLRLGVVATYPALKEEKGTMVSQAEHSLIVTRNGSEVIT